MDGHAVLLLAPHVSPQSDILPLLPPMIPLLPLFPPLPPLLPSLQMVDQPLDHHEVDLHHHQDKLLKSWDLSTIPISFLFHSPCHRFTKSYRFLTTLNLLSLELGSPLWDFFDWCVPLLENFYAY
jgi:hypothetical protein